ncbi:hypothetical protein [Microvirga thermotolerans]|uniref:Uncharacterized protein n=1 Tax=Microvirga thermotolerans TaxID=2651334 RepID=A0A5P9JT26_9HYPH|nr:hypothetical protein [Microvirga thermotolerans]QFU15261.1 hypothetical protein GDR74_02955 [Microvirga thermotolerans]
MPHLVTALYENAGDAHRALQALLEMGMAPTRIVVAGIPEGREVSSISGFRTLSIGADGIPDLRELPLPEEDLRRFSQAVRRGSTLVAAQVGADEEEAVRILEMFSPVEPNEDGSPGTGGSGDRSAPLASPLGAGLTGGMAEGQTNTAALPGMGTMTGGDDPGTSDLRTEDARLGGGSTLPTSGSRDREERPGTGALRRDIA